MTCARPWLFGTVVGALIGVGCTVSTQGGPFFAPQVIAESGDNVTFACIRRYSVAIHGADPWLEQLVRQEWLRLLAERQKVCESSDVRVDLTGVSVRQQTDAFGSPSGGDPEASPPPARMRVATNANLEITACRDGVAARHELGSIGWVPYSSDPFAVEERVAALAKELVRRDARRLDSLLMNVSCEDSYARPLSEQE